MKIVTICNDYWHKGQLYEKAIRTATEDAAHRFIYKDEDAITDLLDDCDLVIISRALSYKGDDGGTVWMTAEFGKSLKKYAKKGGGILLLHGGIVGYSVDKELSQIFGGHFDTHPPKCDVQIKPIGNFEITSGIQTFVYPDEHYYVNVTEDNLEVFLQSEALGHIHPAGWFNTNNNLRVCALTMGHTEEMLYSPEYLKILKRAIKWCTLG